MDAHNERVLNDAMEALYDINAHHASKLRMLTEMSERGCGPSDEFREHSKKRAKIRLEAHVDALERIEVVGDALNSMRLTERLVKRLEMELEARPGLVDLAVIQAQKWWKTAKGWAAS